VVRGRLVDAKCAGVARLLGALPDGGGPRASFPGGTHSSRKKKEDAAYERLGRRLQGWETILKADRPPRHARSITGALGPNIVISTSNPRAPAPTKGYFMIRARRIRLLFDHETAEWHNARIQFRDGRTSPFLNHTPDAVWIKGSIGWEPAFWRRLKMKEKGYLRACQKGCSTGCSPGGGLRIISRRPRPVRWRDFIPV